MVIDSDHLGRTMKKHSLEVPATEFKAKCLELMKEVHDRKRKLVVITKHGKPFAKLVPIEEKHVSILGFMKGRVMIAPGVDLTEPMDVHWEAMDD